MLRKMLLCSAAIRAGTTAVAAALLLTCAALTPEAYAGPAPGAASEERDEEGYKSRYVQCYGADREAAERECDAILARLRERYGVPKRWRVFPVRVEPRVCGAIAGYTLYSAPDVVEVVCYRSLAESRGGVLDHELTHAFFFYLLGSNFDLFLNEGAAQNSEYSNRAALRELVWRQYSAGRFLPLDALYGRNEYDPGLLLYTEGFSVVDFLIGRGGSAWFSGFVEYLTHDAADIDDALAAFYGYASLAELEEDWLAFVRAGQSRGAVTPVAQEFRKSARRRRDTARYSIEDKEKSEDEN